MKFAKELQRELVPEWREKYFDYKLAKKKLKAVARAHQYADGRPKTPKRTRPADLFYSPASVWNPLEATCDPINAHVAPQPPPPSSLRKEMSVDDQALQVDGSQGVHEQMTTDNRANSPHYKSRPLDIPYHQSLSRERSGTLSEERSQPTNYGSIIPTPPLSTPLPRVPSLDLPEPAMDLERGSREYSNTFVPLSRTQSPRSATASTPARAIPIAHDGAGSEVHDSSPSQKTYPRRSVSVQGHRASQKQTLLRRVITNTAAATRFGRELAVADYESKRTEFLAFLDIELKKIDQFYSEREKEAVKRYHLLREQLRVLKAQRTEELRVKQLGKRSNHKAADGPTTSKHGGVLSGFGNVPLRPLSILQKVARDLVKLSRSTSADIQKRFSKTPNYNQSAAPPPQPEDFSQRIDSYRDYVSRNEHGHVPYRYAKRKLKLALQEFYRGLELLKSYAVLNQKAFRKINKKYDKTVGSKRALEYMDANVQKAWFVQSQVLEGKFNEVEDLYSRYFYHGDYKLARDKLRSKAPRQGDYASNIFRNGLSLAAGTVFGIEGVVYAVELLNSSDPTLVVHTSYLLQIYGGYFFMVLLFLLFCLDCRIFKLARINYVFVFEFDTRSVLDWTVLAEIPCFCYFMLGLFMWINFSSFGINAMFLYWPVILTILTLLLIFLPFPILYHKSRKWWAFSLWRLLFAGLYPVEFRDFFLGDMFCSQTYSMGNIELFFCLYAQDPAWGNPPLCNSSHSHLLGFFTALPNVWRALQCIRRFRDTKRAFPHLVNCIKYFCGILYYMSLSLYRIQRIPHFEALFIVCASINATYTSIWDVVMDWSLGDPTAKHFLLRQQLGYHRPWVYYVAMVIDPLLRFNWIFYIIFRSQLQHSAMLSFIVSLSEICRRGMWTIFRVENEHCTNVGRFRAEREMPLPYNYPSSPTITDIQSVEGAGEDIGTTLVPITTAIDAEASPATLSLRRRLTVAATAPIPPRGSPLARGLGRMGAAMWTAHAQDFERKKSRDERGDEEDKEGSSDEDEDVADSDDCGQEGLTERDTTDVEREDESETNNESEDEPNKENEDKGKHCPEMATGARGSD